jgi:hypothetical protein
MSITLIVHVANEEPFTAEIDELPKQAQTSLTLSNPRKLDGRDLHYLSDDVTTMIVPWHRINFLEVIPSRDAEDVIGFVRE